MRHELKMSFIGWLKFLKLQQKIAGDYIQRSNELIKEFYKT